MVARSVRRELPEPVSAQSICLLGVVKPHYAKKRLGATFIVCKESTIFGDDEWNAVELLG